MSYNAVTPTLQDVELDVMPRFSVSMTAVGQVGLEVLCENAPPDMKINIADCTGNVVSVLYAVDVTEGSELEVMLDAARGPFVVGLDSVDQHTSLLDLGVDFGCTHPVTVSII